MPELTLHAAPGACSRVPLITLIEAGADFDVALVKFLKGEHRQPAYLAKNPKGKVPTLMTPEGPLSENVAIALYLSDRFDGLLPRTDSALERAWIVADLAFCAATLHPIVSRIRVPMLIAEGNEAIASVKARAMEAMAPMAQVVESRLADGPWWYGEAWSIMDAYIFWVWFRITGGGFDTRTYPRWAAHAARMNTRPAVREALDREHDMQAALEAEGLAPGLA